MWASLQIKRISSSSTTFAYLIKAHGSNLNGSEGDKVHLLSALINLDHPAHYFGIGAFQISVGNAVIIVAMIIIFILAIALPFPGGKEEK